MITNSCLEEFNGSTIEFADLIVIESTLTDVVEPQTVLLSRTFKIDETQNQQEKESGANVRVISNNTTYSFSETSPGVYISDIAFRANTNTDYQLLVTTQSGKEYQSEVSQLRSDTSSIESLYAVRETNQDGVEGISIYLDSFDPSGNSRFYSYEFEETYQIIVPLWSKEEFNILTVEPFNFEIIPRTEEARICYNTIGSKGRILTDTNLLSEDRVSRLPIKFIPEDDIRLSSRYSISVKQHVNNPSTYDFHETINELSSVGSILSPVQPGFVAGNIASVNDANERVVGYFEIASVREERIFFNRDEFFPSSQYNWNCEPFIPAPPETLPLTALILTDKVSYFEGGNGSPIRVALKRCGDCRESGSNVRPNFWID